MTTVICIYCSTTPNQQHNGFCLTVIENAKEEWMTVK